MNSRRGQHELLGSGMINEQAKTNKQSKYTKTQNTQYHGFGFSVFGFWWFLVFFFRFLVIVFWGLPRLFSEDPRERPIKGRSWARQDRFPT
jgi:hypothetical protein